MLDNIFNKLLRKDKTTGERFRTLFTALGINIIWISLMILFFLYVLDYNYNLIKEFLYPLIYDPNVTTSTYFSYRTARIVFAALILAPLWEEIVFRVLPVRWAKGTEYFIPAILTVSIIFGLLHGSIINILIQGAGGLILCCVYIRTQSYWFTVIHHVIWNFLIIFTNLFI